MRRLVPLTALALVGGCQQQVAVPTAQDLLGNRQMLSEWQGKCNTGEYSQLPAARKGELCSTTQEATISASELSAGNRADDFYDANTKRN